MRRLAVSNIIWNKGREEFENFLILLSDGGIQGVELALNCVWPEPTEMTQLDIGWLKSLLDRYSLSISSLHSVTYTRPDLELFAGQATCDKLLDYLKHYINLAQILGAGNIVFGSPQTRRKHGAGIDECNEIFRNFLSRADEYCSGVWISIEPLPQDICEYLNTFSEAVSLIGPCGFQNIFVQLDARVAVENGEKPGDLLKYIKYIKHCQVSDPGLTPPGTLHPDFHRTMSVELASAGYAGYIAAEVLFNENGDRSTYVKDCIHKLKYYYGREHTND